MNPSRLVLEARPADRASIALPDAAGELLSIDVGGGRPTRIRLPVGVAADTPAPLALLLHGSGGDPEQSLGLLGPYAEAAGIVLVAPASVDYTWDMIAQSRFDADVEAIDRALGWVFERQAVDVRRLAIGGFSDGASYALSLAIANGALFSHAIALSPGFVAGTPGRSTVSRVFVSHGMSDRVLPVSCSRRIVPALRAAGIDVRYIEFIGEHEIPAPIAESAVRWLVGS